LSGVFWENARLSREQVAGAARTDPTRADTVVRLWTEKYMFIETYSLTRFDIEV
jgi:hypothetical protein